MSPFGNPIESRPPIPTPEERLATYKQKRFIKLERRTLRRRAAHGIEDAIQQLKDMGLDPGVSGVSKHQNAPKLVKKESTPKDGAVLGEKGQKLPEGVLPGGTHEVSGDINERALHNSGKARKFEEKAKDNLVEAEEKDEELARKGIASDSALR